MGYYDITTATNSLSKELERRGGLLLINRHLSDKTDAVGACRLAIIYHLLNNLNVSDEYDTELLDMFFGEEVCVKYVEGQLHNIRTRIGKRPVGAFWSSMVESLAMEIGAGNVELKKEFEILLRKQYQLSCPSQKTLENEMEFEQYIKKHLYKQLKSIRKEDKDLVAVSIEEIVPYYWYLEYGDDSLRRKVSKSLTTLLYNQDNMCEQTVYTSLDRALEILGIKAEAVELCENRILQKYLSRRIREVADHISFGKHNINFDLMESEQVMNFVREEFERVLDSTDATNNSIVYYDKKTKEEILSHRESGSTELPHNMLQDLEHIIEQIKSDDSDSNVIWPGDYQYPFYYPIAQLVTENKLFLLDAIKTEDRKAAFLMALYSLSASSITLASRKRDINLSTCIRLGAPEDIAQFSQQLFSAYIINLLSMFVKEKDSYVISSSVFGDRKRDTKTGHVTEITKSLLRGRLDEAEKVNKDLIEENQRLRKELEEANHKISIEKDRAIVCQFSELEKRSKELAVERDNRECLEHENKEISQYVQALEMELKNCMDELDVYRQKGVGLSDDELFQKRYLFLGGRYELIEYLQRVMTKSYFIQNERESLPDMEKIEVIYIFYNNIHHAAYFKLINIARKLNIPVKYIRQKNLGQVMEYLRGN